MSIVIEGVYERGVITLKDDISIPDKTEVLVFIDGKKSKENFLKAAGSWRDIDLSVFDTIMNSRENKRERGFIF